MIDVLYFFQPSASSYSRHVVHDIPVTVIPRRLWSDYKDPQREEFDVQ